MNLDEVIEVIKRGAAEGKAIVRLHTGDPAIYGAIQEQMDRLQELGITYAVVPRRKLLPRNGSCFEAGIHVAECVSNGNYYAY